MRHRTARLMTTILGGKVKALSAYDEKVLAIQPAALKLYLPMSETSGTTANDYSGGNRNLTYTGVTLGDAGIGDGKTAAFFDGLNDYLNVGAVMDNIFSGAAGTYAVWAKVYNAGVWTDLAVRRLCYLRVNASNYIYILKDGTSQNRLAYRYVAATTSELINRDASNSTAWMHVALTWDRAAGADGEVKAYYNGTQTGSTATALGTWSGTTLATAFIGSSDATPANPWYGWMGKVGWWNAALTAEEIASLATV